MDGQYGFGYTDAFLVELTGGSGAGQATQNTAMRNLNNFPQSF